MICVLRAALGHRARSLRAAGERALLRGDVELAAELVKEARRIEAGLRGRDSQDARRKRLGKRELVVLALRGGKSTRKSKPRRNRGLLREEKRR